MNYLGCAHCHQRDFVLINNKATEEEDGEEIVTYDRESPLLSRHQGPFKWCCVLSCLAFCSLSLLLSFSDVCKNCDHVIARHEYTFSVVDEYQVRHLCTGTKSNATFEWDLVWHLVSFLMLHIFFPYLFCFILCCSRSTQCSACFVEKQKTPSACYLTTPDSRLLSFSSSSFAFEWCWVVFLPCHGWSQKITFHNSLTFQHWLVTGTPNIDTLCLACLTLCKSMNLLN